MSFTVQEILELTQGRLANGDALGESMSQIRVTNAAPLAMTRESDVGFFFSREYEKEILSAKPGVLVTAEPFVQPLQASGLPLWKKTAVIACRDPYFAMALVSEKIAERTSTVTHIPGSRAHTAEPKVHPTAVVDPSAKLGRGVEIQAYCVIEAGAEIGDGTLVYPHAYIGPRVKIGKDGVLFSRVTLYEWTEIGDRVRLHSGVVLGADGFGYAPKLEGKNPTDHQKIYHLGRVLVGDDVEIGANSLADRSTFGETHIASKVKIDNHCHLGHNARVDEGAILCGGVCLAGGAHVGKFAYVGGMTGIGNRVHIGEYAKIGAMAMIANDVPANSVAIGNPQRDYRSHYRIHALLNRMLEEHESKRSKK